MPQNHLPHNYGQTIEQELEHMPSVENFQTVADIFKQLGDGSRIRIFWLLCHCEECVINLSAMMEMSSPAVSHHLKQLKVAGLIVSRREGKEVYYKAERSVQSSLRFAHCHLYEGVSGTPSHDAAAGDRCHHCRYCRPGRV